MPKDNKQSDPKEMQKKSLGSNYVIIPLALAATLCAWINNVPNSEPFIKAVEAYWKLVIYLVFAAVLVLGDGNALQKSTRAGKAALGALAAFAIVFGNIALTK